MSDQISETIQYIIHTIHSVFNITTCKVVFTFIYFLYAFLFDATKTQSYIALLILILFDFITGVYAAKITNEPIRSSKIRHTALKITVYFTMISGSFLAERGIYDIFAVLDETVIAFLLVTELISLIENVGKMGFKTPKKLLNTLQNYSEQK